MTIVSNKDSAMQDDITSKIEAYFEKYRIRKYAKGQVLILSGEQPDYIYHLLDGKVKQYDVTYRGDEIILNIFKPPAFFPMSHALNKTPNPYIYEAETDIELHQVPSKEVVKFLEENPDVLLDLLSRLYSGVDGLLGRITYLMSGSAKSRLIYELVIEARRFGTKQNDGSCTIDISEKELGARAGLSRETVSREMAKLKSEGLVGFDGKIIHLKDMAMLEKKLGQEI